MRIQQLCARIEFGDAVSNHVLEIDRALSSWGHETGIFANTCDEFGRQVARPDSEFTEFLGSTDDLLIFHYSVYCPNYEQYLGFKGKRILVYHNITPPEFFSQYDKGVAEFCRLGRELLPRLAECDLALGDSEYNRLELVDMGFARDRTGVLPIFVDYEGLLEEKPDEGVAPALRSGFNVLFVGRRVPNKRLEDVLRAFFYYNRCVSSDSRLWLVGPTWVDRYDAQLQWLVDSYGLWESVHFAGRVSRPELASYYDAADLFLSMSEHEGFAVPLVESMAFDTPVLAYSSSAVPYTLDGAGMTFDEKDYAAVGELMDLIRRDAGLKTGVLAGQRNRLKAFSREAVGAALKEALERVL